MRLFREKFLHHSKKGIPKSHKWIWFVLYLPSLTLQTITLKIILPIPAWVSKLQSTAKCCSQSSEKHIFIQDTNIYLFRPQIKRQNFQTRILILHLHFKINTMIHWNCNRIPNNRKTRTLTKSHPVDSASGLLDNSFTGLQRRQLYLLNPWQLPRELLTLLTCVSL